MKKKRYKISKLEKERYSIVTDDLEHCYLCGGIKNHLHEVFYGSNRVNSMRYGCVIPLCDSCHTKIHQDIELDLGVKKLLESAFLGVYECDIDFFIKIFHFNYIKKD